MSKKIDSNSVPHVKGSSYPQPFAAACAERIRQRLGDAAGLTQFGVNLTCLPSGAWSSQRHWHSDEDEFIFVIDGDVVLVTESGEEQLHPGDCVGFKAGTADGHHLQNRSSRDAVLLEIGTRRPTVDETTYPDIDLKVPKGQRRFAHTDGTPYE